MAFQHANVEQAGLISEDEVSRKQREVQEDEAAQVQVVKWENYKAPIPQDHAKFMRKVFLTLTLQLIVTAIVLGICCYVEEVRKWILVNYWIYWVGIGGVVCILCTLMFNVNKYPVNVCLLCVFTLFMAFTVGTLTAAYAQGYGPDLV
eukprot:389645_1